MSAGFAGLSRGLSVPAALSAGFSTGFSALAGLAGSSTGILSVFSIGGSIAVGPGLASFEPAAVAALPLPVAFAGAALPLSVAFAGAALPDAALPSLPAAAALP